MPKSAARILVLLLSAFGAAYTDAQTSSPQPVVFRIQAASSLGGPVSGRLIVFLKQGKGDKEVDTEEFHPENTYVAAREIRGLAPGASKEADWALAANVFENAARTMATNRIDLIVIAPCVRSVTL
jgi:hypothetical protein